ALQNRGAWPSSTTPSASSVFVGAVWERVAALLAARSNGRGHLHRITLVGVTSAKLFQERRQPAAGIQLHRAYAVIDLGRGGLLHGRIEALCGSSREQFPVLGNPQISFTRYSIGAFGFDARVCCEVEKAPYPLRWRKM